MLSLDQNILGLFTSFSSLSFLYCNNVFLSETHNQSLANILWSYLLIPVFLGRRSILFRLPKNICDCRTLFQSFLSFIPSWLCGPVRISINSKTLLHLYKICLHYSIILSIYFTLIYIYISNIPYYEILITSKLCAHTSYLIFFYWFVHTLHFVYRFIRNQICIIWFALSTTVKIACPRRIWVDLTDYTKLAFSTKWTTSLLLVRQSKEYLSNFTYNNPWSLIIPYSQLQHLSSYLSSESLFYWRCIHQHHANMLWNDPVSIYLVIYMSLIQLHSPIVSIFKFTNPCIKVICSYGEVGLLQIWKVLQSV